MIEDRIDRKEFMTILGRAGAGTCMCGAVLSARLALGTEPDVQAQGDKLALVPQTRPGEKSPARAAKRMEFVDGWVPRLFTVMDAELDEPTRRRIMAANGRACFSAYKPELNRRPGPATREYIAGWVAQHGRSGGYSMDGEAILMEFLGSAETGEASPAGVCLCPTAEAQGVKRISPTFCWCSVGYVKEMHDRVFGRPVNVEPLESVLMGHPRCKFRITLA